MRNKFIQYSFIALSFVFAFTSCLEYDDYKATDTLKEAPNASIAVGNVGEDAITVTVSSDAAGAVSYVLMKGNKVDEAPAADDVLTLNVGGVVEDGSKILDGEARNWEITLGGDLDHNTVYTLFAVTANTDGVWSEVASKVLQTDDFTDPEQGSVTPGVTNEPTIAVDAAFTLIFSEVVEYVDTKKVTLNYFDEGIEVEVPVDSISVNGNEVTIKQNRTPDYSTIIFLSYEDGAFVDLVGNEVEGVESGINEDNELVGMYFVTEEQSFAIDTDNISPEIQTGQSDLSEVSVSFDEDIFVSDDYATGDISITIYGIENGASYEKAYKLAASAISTSGATATISLPEVPDYGEKVALNISERALVDEFENPVEALESTDEEGAWWLRSYNRDINVLVGTYTVTCTSYWGGDYTENLTVALDPENEDQVIITGFQGTTTEVVAVFDKDFSTLVIPEPEAPILVDAGVFELYLAYYSGFGPMEAFVEADGSTTVPFGYWYEDLADSSASGWYDLYPTTTWVKAAPGTPSMKSAVSVDYKKAIKKL